jgi:hypothetical protein
MLTSTFSFTISEERRQRRTANIRYGALFSLVLVVLVAWATLEQPQTYDTVLLWSAVGFVVIANVVGYLRHRRYLRLARGHRLEIGPRHIRFETGGQNSELSAEDIASVTVYRNRKRISHIQIKRTDNRGIRLEDYGDMDGMAAALKALVPPAHWRDSGVSSDKA